MNKNLKYSVETIMVSLLLIIFSIMVVALIFEGSIQYQKTLNIKDSQENARIALSFVNMKIKQNDIAGRITIDNKEGFGDTIIVAYGGEEEGLYSYIYFKNGALYECYSDGTLSDELSTKVVDVDAGKIEKIAEDLVKISLEANDSTISRTAAIRTKFKVEN